MKRKLPEKFFEQNQRAKTRKWKFFNLNQALWGAGNREFRRIAQEGKFPVKCGPYVFSTQTRPPLPRQGIEEPGERFRIPGSLNRLNKEFKMRHRSGLRKLNRTSAHRLAMLRNMMNSLLEHEAIKTTVPKAKELRRVVEPMITLAKVDTVANRRLAFNRLRNRAIVTKLFEVLGPRFANRNGGYTRILKMGFRVGDNAPMAYMELTERAEAVEEVKEEKAAE